MKKRLKVIPVGVTVGPNVRMPAMIFRDEKERENLAIWLDPVDAGVLLSGNKPELRTCSPHRLALKIFGALGVQVKSIYFNRIIGTSQYASVVAIQGEKRVEIQARAAEIMSFASHTGCEFYTNMDFIERSREVELMWAVAAKRKMGRAQRAEDLH